MNNGVVRRFSPALAALFAFLSVGLALSADEGFIEPANPYLPSAYSSEVLKRVKIARTQGKLSDELWLTLDASASNPQHFELWDNVAELSCREAHYLSNGGNDSDRVLASTRRQMGLALVNEFRCAVAVVRGERACFLPAIDDRLTPLGLGGVPNPAVTPLCFQSLCGDGFRSDVRHRAFTGNLRAGRRDRAASLPESFSWVDHDASNLDKIEAYCRSQ